MQDAEWFQTPSLYSEGNAAARVGLEREVRGWSTTELAARMTKAGVPMNQTAVWRIENSTPRRKITLDEALGFARVFELPLEELMSPPLAGLDVEARRLIQEAVEAFVEKQAAEDRLHHAVVATAAYLQGHPDASGNLLEQCIRLLSDGREAQGLWNHITEGRYYN
ncbi:helix-turn-helix domain-containing protein [Streptacidiphilus sp. P02-A3a]|uniref:helix-turn-helix domain-containing protein n=1 Tax=Streptacidiphilus sp. P02-A3a TaxID=2704468 RepID=UPI0015FE5AB5|nr:helix-turn-helix transcriptional regulator [Streptacidiphilus sp. P02-A3a]QMU67179.1 helix-turn-helix transcriptional regulator [Streptacidiphilus sp. P02-A3a]